MVPVEYLIRTGHGWLDVSTSRSGGELGFGSVQWSLCRERNFGSSVENLGSLCTVESIESWEQ